MFLIKTKMIFLAGGIDETNVKRAISQVAPDVIDLSSAVEKQVKMELFTERIQKNKNNSNNGT